MLIRRCNLARLRVGFLETSYTENWNTILRKKTHKPISRPDFFLCLLRSSTSIIFTEFCSERRRRAESRYRCGRCKWRRAWSVMISARSVMNLNTGPPSALRRFQKHHIANVLPTKKKMFFWFFFRNTRFQRGSQITPSEQGYARRRRRPRRFSTAVSRCQEWYTYTAMTSCFISMAGRWRWRDAFLSKGRGFILVSDFLEDYFCSLFCLFFFF